MPETKGECFGVFILRWSDGKDLIFWSLLRKLDVFFLVIIIILLRNATAKQTLASVLHTKHSVSITAVKLILYLVH